ncbi:MAG: peptidyl-tRNA hydrolase [Thermoproteales archaeon]|nr:peptidyl-tRNA hydrolase [Thermoproteales archaeon]
MKQVIVVRIDLKMGKGKLATQVAHAAVTAYETVRNIKYKWAIDWLTQGQRKIVLKVENLEILLKIYNEVVAMGLPAVLIRDSGLTQLKPGTITALGIGPVPSELIDPITGKLKLL